MADDGGILGALVSLSIGAAVAAYFGAFYTTGTQYFKVCYERKVYAQPSSTEQNKDPYKEMAWNNCNIIGNRALYSNGMVYTGFYLGPTADQLRNACPDERKDIPGGGIYLWIIDKLSSTGGPTLTESFTPAEWMIFRLLKAAWPNCAQERVRQGFPAVIEKPSGTFEWAEPCTKCK